jgi:hypothetical protein
MQQISNPDQDSRSATGPTGKRNAAGLTARDNDDEETDTTETTVPSSPEVRKRADLKGTPNKPAPITTDDTHSAPSTPSATSYSPVSTSAQTQSPNPWTPDSVSTMYPDHPNHPLHLGGDGPSDNEHETDTLMSSPRFSPYHKTQTGEFEDDDITPTQLEDIYMQHDDSNRVSDSHQPPVDPRTETGEAPRSPTTEDKNQPSQATPAAKVTSESKK